jgi:hypothetical protein
VRKLLGQSSEPPPSWFEEGSSFFTRLTTELGGISHKISLLPWTGANSISERDQAAHDLAKHLSTEHADQPQATQLIIAHSHGGNIALRALHQLQQRDASQLSGGEKQTPLVVTLATPFVEVHHADFGARPFFVRMALLLAIVYLEVWLQPLSYLAPPGSAYGFAITIFSSAVMFAILCFGLSWWIIRRAPARRARVEALRDATRLGKIASAQAQRLLVIRAIDDEASLIMALGAIFNYVTVRVIAFAFLISGVLSSVIINLWVDFLPALQLAFAALTIMLLGLLVAARTVHGWTLAVSPMECQINTQSTPDAKGLSAIVTLVRRTYVKSLRHGIYDHEDCARTISDWVRSQLCMPHEVGDSKGTQCIGRA